MWDIRDGLQVNLNKKELQLMLKDNRQKVPKGESEASVHNTSCSKSVKF